MFCNVFSRFLIYGNEIVFIFSFRDDLFLLFDIIFLYLCLIFVFKVSIGKPFSKRVFLTIDRFFMWNLSSDSLIDSLIISLSN